MPLDPCRAHHPVASNYGDSGITTSQAIRGAFRRGWMRSHEPALVTKTNNRSKMRDKVCPLAEHGRCTNCDSDARIATTALSDQYAGLIEKIVDYCVAHFSVASGNADNLLTEVFPRQAW
jgi:hypothetical protein